MLTAAILQHLSFPVAMPLLPEDRNLVVLAGDGYVAGTALALILFPEPKFSQVKVSHPYRVHERAQAKVALKIKFIAMCLAVLLASVWLLGHFHVFRSSGYHVLPSDRSLFAAIPLFGIADMIAAIKANLFVKYKDEPLVDEPLIRRRELGDTDGQLYSITLASVYLGFWLTTIAFSN